MAGDSGYFLEKLRSMNLLKYEVNRVRLELADLIHCFADHRIRANLVRRVYFLIRIDMAYRDSAFPSKVSCFLFLHRPAYRRVLVIVLLFRRLLLFRLDLRSDTIGRQRYVPRAHLGRRLTLVRRDRVLMSQNGL